MIVHLGLEKGLALQDVIHQLAAVEWPGEEEQPLVQRHVAEEAHDIRVVEGGPQGDLALRLAAMPGRHGVRFEHLDRSAAFDRGVPRVQHHAEGAAAQHAAREFPDVATQLHRLGQVKVPEGPLTSRGRMPAAAGHPPTRLGSAEGKALSAARAATRVEAVTSSSSARQIPHTTRGTTKHSKCAALYLTYHSQRIARR